MYEYGMSMSESFCIECFMINYCVFWFVCCVGCEDDIGGVGWFCWERSCF